MNSRSNPRPFRRTIRYLVPLSALSLLVATSGCGSKPKPTSTPTPSPSKLSLPDLIAKTRPSVVEIRGQSRLHKWESGSGIIIDTSKGLVLTNDHVVGGLSGLEAFINEKTQDSVKIVAQAPCDDLAVVKFRLQHPDLTALPLGNSNLLRAGDQVTALGYGGTAENPSEPPQHLDAVQGTVSDNNISASPGPDYPSLSSVILHQAPLSPGYSGGPLLNEKGDVVGVNTLTNGQGQNYSISINAVKDVLPQLTAGKSLEDLGWSFVPMSPEIAHILTSPPDPWAAPPVSSKGLLVINVETGSVADAAKFHFGDIITDIEGIPTNDVSSVCKIVKGQASGTKIAVRGYEITPDLSGWEPYRVEVTMP